MRAYSGEVWASLVGAGLLIGAPAFGLLAGSTFAEPLFGMFLVCHLFSFLKIMNRNGAARYVYWIWFAASGALLIATKKEGILLVGLMLAFSTVTYVRRALNRLSDIKASLGMVAVAAALVTFSVLALRILDAAERHANDISAPAFSIGYIQQLFPALAAAATDVHNFGLLWIFWFLAIPVLIVARHRVGLALACVSACYALLYSAHARHSAFVHGASVDSVEMIRYVYALSPVGAIVVGITLGRPFQVLRASLDPRACSWVTAVLAVCFVLAGVSAMVEIRQQKIAMHENEKLRIEIGLDAIQQHKIEHTVLISPNSAALFALGIKNMKIVDDAFIASPAATKLISQVLELGGQIIVDARTCAAKSVARAWCHQR